MHALKRRPRRWHLTSKALLFFLAVPVIAVSTLDGVNYREMATLAVVLACGLLIAHRADKLQDELDHLERRLRHRHHQAK